jgi:hypothetical protein
MTGRKHPISSSSHLCQVWKWVAVFTGERVDPAHPDEDPLPSAVPVTLGQCAITPPPLDIDPEPRVEWDFNPPGM